MANFNWSDWWPAVAVGVGMTVTIIRLTIVEWWYRHRD